MQLVLGSEENQVIHIGELFYKVQIHKRELDVCFPSGRLERMRIICLYEIKQGLFWWNYSSINNNSSIDIASCLEKWSFQVLDNKIVGFKLSTGQIWYIESTQKYDSLHKACNYLMSHFEKQLDKIEKSDIDNPYLYRAIPLFRYIDRHFFYPPDKCIFSLRNPQASMKITSYKDKWKIELEGVNKRQATVILSNDYQVLEVWLDGVKKEIIEIIGDRPHLMRK
jgi:hypothetical protein